MNRLGKALIAVLVGIAAPAAFVVTSSIPGQAEASLVAKYRCTGGIAGEGVNLEARMTPQLVSGTLNVRWDMSYEGNQRFGSPGFFARGSRLDLEGTVDIDGAWIGQLKPKGGKEQKRLVPGSFLELPEGLSHSAAITETGRIRLKPGALALRFTPAAGEWVVNNRNRSESVQYTGPWNWEYTYEDGDHLNDLTGTTAKDSVAKLEFKGTKVAYIGRRAPGLGPVRVLLDGEEVTSQLVEPGKARNGEPMTATRPQEVLWESDVLEYKPHTIEVINVEDKTAYVDAFKVTIGSIEEPPVHDQATCELQGDPGAIDINIASPTPTDDTTDEPTDEPTDQPTDPNNPDPDDPPGNDDDDDQPPVDDGNSDIGVDDAVVNPQTSGTATSTPTTASPTATKYYRAQVAKTPSGGVDTGVAPAEPERPYALMAGGMALVMGSAGGGLLLRRRRAAHAGGAR